MKQLVWLSFTLLLISFFNVNTSFAAFPVKSNAPTTIITPPAAATTITTSQNQTQEKHLNFIQRLMHPSDSVFGLFSLLSLIFGAVGLIVAFFTFGGFALGLAAVVLGAIGWYMGAERKMATLGVVLGIIAMIIALII